MSLYGIMKYIMSTIDSFFVNQKALTRQSEFIKMRPTRRVAHAKAQASTFIDIVILIKGTDVMDGGNSIGITSKLSNNISNSS